MFFDRVSQVEQILREDPAAAYGEMDFLTRDRYRHSVEQLARRSTGKTLFILDEPSTGLSFYDVDHLLAVLNRLVDGGNSVLVIEHNLDIIKQADHLIDLGPEGGDRGGMVVASGTPAEVAAVPGSYTGHFLRPLLQRHVPVAAS